MSPILPDGVYKFTNVQFNGFAATVARGAPGDAISAYPEGTCPENCYWKVTNIRGSGNVVTLESCYVPGLFANPQIYPPQPGTQVVLATSAAKWIVRKFGDKIVFQDVGSYYFWNLPVGEIFQPIQLFRNPGNPEAQWTFQYIRKSCS